MSKQASETPFGSQRLLQLAVNRRPELLKSALRKSCALGRRESVFWVSPLVSDGYCEYRDNTALFKLGIDKNVTVPLKEFWPARGPVWDALAHTDKGRPILIEAKAHIPESASPGTKASAPSRKLIEASLHATRKYLAPKSKSFWIGTFYQYANRLAYQYYLRNLNQIESSLVFLNFTNAVDMDGPATEEEWRGATRLIHAVLGLPPNLEHFGVYHAYIDTKLLTDAV